jgi:hypothetical protein
LKAYNAIDEVIALKPNCSISIPRGKAGAREQPRQLGSRLGDIHLRVNVTSDGDVGAGQYHRRLSWEICTRTFDRHANVTRTTDRTGLIDRQANPLDAELFEQRQGQTIRHRLYQLEF